MSGEGRARASVTPIENAARFGVKGPNAAAWLQRHSVATPDQANTWCALHPGALDADIVVRLGAGEYFLEHSGDRAIAETLARELESAAGGVYPVLREDRGFLLEGVSARAVLAQICSLNFDELPHPNAAVMTMMIGVAVIVVPQGNAAQRRYRIWCDPSYGDYMYESLRAVVDDVSGQHGE
jgi:sarcosine oxidase subunit gamma